MTIEGAPATYDDLSAVYVNCTLKRSPATSHTQFLMDHSATIMERAGASVTQIRAVDHDIAFGMSPDMGDVDADDGGVDHDGWPAIERQILDADILVLGSPIWLGEKSSVATMVIERLYSWSSETNDKGQYLYYGKTAACVVTGNEDGVKHCAMGINYALAHVGFMIPPQPDCGWIGEIGPGPSYGDDVEGSDIPNGFDHEFTMKNTTFMTWNLLHTARMLRDAGGVPAFGNVGSDWSDGKRFGYPDPTR
ncbi:MAG: flavodoxin family protein [Acidimicrobiales bacterium]